MAQDVTFYRRLPVSPADFNFSPDSTVLEIWTEFLVESSAPVITTSGASPDQTLDFGVTRFARGSAYVQDSQELHPVPVEKTWLEIDNKHFLVESISYLKLKPLLDTLQASITSTNKSETAKSTFPDRATLVAKGFSRTPKPLLSASIRASQGPSERGVVADYQTINTSLTNFVAAASSTYFITGPVSVNSVGGAPALTIEGGSCLKFTNSPTAGLILNGPMLCKTGPYRMATLSCWSDDSIGETLSGSSGSPTNFNGATYIASSIYGSSTYTNSYRYLRFAYAGKGLGLIDDSRSDVWHCQFVRCGVAMSWCEDCSGAFYGIHNALFAQCGAMNSYGGNVNGEHVTVDEGALFTCGGCGGNFTNSIFTGVTNLASSFFDHCVTNSSSAGLYQTAGAGNYYLAPSSTNRGAGTAMINSDLLAAIKRKTSYPPIIFSNIIVLTNMTISPQAQRNTGVPDRGYLYDPIDAITHLVSLTNLSLTLSPGTAVACYNRAGIEIHEGSSITSIGTPLAPNWLVSYQGVQEQPIALGGSTASWSVNTYHVGTPEPTGNFRFTRFVCSPGGGIQFYDGSFGFGTLLLQDSEVWGGASKFDGAANTSITLKNNLFYRGTCFSYASVTNSL